MIITKTSALTGIEHSLDLPITQEQLARYNEGIEHVQHIFPNLDANQREFLISGSTKEEWDTAFKEVE